MSFFNFILIIISILFVFIFIYGLIYNNNKIISFRTVKTPYYKEVINNNSSDSKLKCEDKCSTSSCCEFNRQKELYNNCIKCSKKFMCFNKYSQECELCFFGDKSCKEYGCINGPPINPKDNNCIKCW